MKGKRRERPRPLVYKSSRTTLLSAFGSREGKNLSNLNYQTIKAMIPDYSRENVKQSVLSYHYKIVLAR